MMTTPLQRNLDRGFAADRKVIAYGIAVEADASCAEAQTARGKVCVTNAAFLSGQNGRRVLRDFTVMISNFDATAWQRERLSEAEQLQSAFDLCKVCVAAWFKLVRFQLCPA